MNKMVIQLQKEIISNEKDVVSLLREAKVISTKLGDDDFKKWIDLELNGYQDYSEIPEYRKVTGQVKARNPFVGLIPVVMPDSIEEALTTRKISISISELINLKDKETIAMEFTSEISEILCKDSNVHFACYFIISKTSICRIIESVKNRLLEWSLSAEKNTFLNPAFVDPIIDSASLEKEQSKSINQQINNYGTIINGAVSESQIVSGDNALIAVGLPEMMAEIKGSVEKEVQNEEKRKEALEILEDINESIRNGKKKSIIKSALLGLKDFLINLGATITAALITSKITGLM